ncbi:MAG: ABC transporter permease [Lunatimonas sp.]|uniref:ABC transporter permease n=1 Tax=Lunatimonas sp. TaxID=2060141 RepID=UPI00263BC15B|nr:FtsX-like permease family protein [Lunatimonas sp.]MCC5939661.1 ABC transporter permease [Lunatimonas sp.]
MGDLKWVLLMAMRDFRKNGSKLALFISSILVGIAALVAISSFGDNLTKDINRQAKELLGADLVLSNNQPFEGPDLDSMLVDQAMEINFASMVSFVVKGESRLTQVRALEGRFPFYGSFDVEPLSGEESFRAGGKKALVENLLLAQFDAQVGDFIKVGEVTYEIAGALHKVPGQTGITATVAPAVYIPMETLEETGLVQFGSRVNYELYYALTPDADPQVFIDAHKDQWEEDNIRFETVESRKESTGNSFKNLGNFLSLVAFIAVLLGCVGVASAVNVFVKEKLPAVAVLRCLGVSSGQIFAIYLWQIFLMGAIGSVAGAALGTGLQFILPSVFQDFLPVDVTVEISWASIFLGVFTGILISMLFALIPLLKIRTVSPMMTLRPEEGSTRFAKDPIRWAVVVGIALFLSGFSYFLLRDWIQTLWFTGFVFFAFGVLWLFALGIMKGIRHWLPLSLSYPARQSLANLYRPNNQTISLIATIGLGTAMISTLFFVQYQLLGEVKFADKEDQPNMLFFDIQTQQVEAVSKQLTDQGLPILQQVPIVTMGLTSVNGVTKKDNESLPEEERFSKRLYNREFRVTYRDSLIRSERLTDGELRPYKQSGDSIFVSLDKGYASRAGLQLGDELVFNVQGRPLKTYIGSMREVNFRQVSTNFLVLFPDNVLTNAPKFHVVVTKTASDVEAGKIQNQMVQNFPNVSVINLSTIVETLEEILGKISFVIQFMALFSIVTGILVLISSLIISKYQRIKETILLKTIGAQTSLLIKINTLEYLFLGSLAALSGILLSLLAAFLLSVYLFEIPFSVEWLLLVAVYAAITAITVLLGWWNGKDILKTPTMEVLRT